MFALAGVILFTRGVFSKDLTNALKRVTDQEQVLQQKADILEQRLGQMERDYHVKLKRAEADAEHLLEDAKQQAANVRASAVEEAKHRVRQLLLEAEHARSQQIKISLLKELNGKTAHRACEVLQDLLPAEQLALLDERLIRELMDTLAHMDVHPVASTVAHVDVTTAQPLPSAVSQQLAQWAVASFGPTVPLHVQVNPALIAGGVVQLGPTTVDNCLLNRLGQR